MCIIRVLRRACVWSVHALAFSLLVGFVPGAAFGQNPVQWSGNVEHAVARAAEQTLPLLFWVTDNDDSIDDDLSDAQSHSFRDAAVVTAIQKHFVAVRVSRTSRVLKEAERLGLPTSHGLYCAVLTHDGRLLDQMGPGEIADPVAFAAHLDAAFDRFCDDLMDKELRPIFDDPKASKSRLRLAARTVWRLGIRKADKDIVGLLAREDLTPTEAARVYELLASLGTRDAVGALLDRSEENAAAEALAKADAGALEWVIPELPAAESAPTARQLAAYRAAARMSRMTAQKPDTWWEKAGAAERSKEIERVTAKATSVLEYFNDRRGE